MEYMIYFDKLNKKLENKITLLEQKIKKYSEEEQKKQEEKYISIQQMTIEDLLEKEMNHIVTFFTSNKIEEDNLELIEQSKFLYNTLNTLDDTMKDFFVNTQQYQSTMNKINEKLNQAKQNAELNYKNIENENISSYKEQKDALKLVKQKITKNGFFGVIDKEQEVNLFFHSIESFSEEEQLFFAKQLFLNNIEKYSKKESKETIEDTPIEEISKKEILEDTTTEEISKEENIEILEEENKFILSKEEQQDIEILEKIISDYQGKVETINIPFYEMVITSVKDWLKDDNYNLYKEDLEIYFLSKKYNDFKKDMLDLEMISKEEKKEYETILRNDFDSILEVLHDFVETHPNYSHKKEQDHLLQENKNNILFLLDENHNPYIVSDIEEKDKQVKNDTLRAIDKLRLGYVSSKNSNWSGKFYKKEKVMLYREFCNSGVIELAYIPLTKSDLLIVGSCDNSREDLRSSAKIDKQITQRINSIHYNEQLLQYKTFLANPSTKTQIVEEHAAHLENMKQIYKVR